MRRILTSIALIVTLFAANADAQIIGNCQTTYIAPSHSSFNCCKCICPTTTVVGQPIRSEPFFIGQIVYSQPMTVTAPAQILPGPIVWAPSPILPPSATATTPAPVENIEQTFTGRTWSTCPDLLLYSDGQTWAYTTTKCPRAASPFVYIYDRSVATGCNGSDCRTTVTPVGIVELSRWEEFKKVLELYRRDR